MTGSSQTPKDKENKDETPEIEESLPSTGETEPSADESESSAEGSESDVSGSASEAEDLEADDRVSDVADNDEERDNQSEPTPVPGVIPAAVTPAPAVVSAPTPAPKPASSTFALVAGGLIAGALGFLIATYAVPERPAAAADDAPDLTDQVAEQASRIDALLEQFDEFRSAPVAVSSDAPPVDLTPIQDRQSATEASVAEVGTVLQTIEESLAALDSRLAALESDRGNSGPDGSAAMEAQLEAFRSELDAVTAEAKAEVEAAQARASEIETAAAEAAAQAEREAAIAEIRAALESGAPYADALTAFDTVPDALAAPAENGVATLASLQQSFPDAARQTLQASGSAASDGTATERFAAFLRRQTNARSLSPRDGQDADAVLSRSESALNEGDLATALSELEALGGDLPDDMAAWVAAARTRAEAVDAAASLGTATN